MADIFSIEELNKQFEEAMEFDPFRDSMFKMNVPTEIPMPTIGNIITTPFKKIKPKEEETWLTN